MSYIQDQMIAMFNQLQQGLIDRVTDTGWVEIPLSGHNVIWSGSGRARRIGNLVQLEFSNIRSTSKIESDVWVANGLEARFVPAKTEVAPILAMPGSGMMHGGFMSVRNDGIVMITPLAGAPYIPHYGVYARIVYMID